MVMNMVLTILVIIAIVSSNIMTMKAIRLFRFHQAVTRGILLVDSGVSLVHPLIAAPRCMCARQGTLPEDEADEHNMCQIEACGVTFRRPACGPNSLVFAPAYDLVAGSAKPKRHAGTKCPSRKRYTTVVS